MMGGPLERLRQNQIFNKLDKTIPQQLRAFVDIRGGNVPSIPDGSSVIDPISTFGAAGMAALISAPRTTLPRDVSISMDQVTDTLTKHLAPEEAQAVMQKVQEAEQTGSEEIVSKAYGAALSIYPELRQEFAPGKTIANSEFNGYIADPNDKRMLKMKLSAATRGGRESTLDAAKFVSDINEGRKIKSAPKTIRQPKDRVSTGLEKLGAFEPGLQPADPLQNFGQ
jgi:hypothetical protein